MRLSRLNLNWLLVAVALIFGCFSAWAINRHLTDKTLEIESRSRLPIVSKVVASQNLKKGRALSMEDLAVRDFNDPLYGISAVDPDEVDLLVGKVLMHDVNEGQIIPSSFVSSKIQSHLVSRLDSGMRAITIPVDQINSMSGLLKPTDRIDLLVSFDHQGQRITSPLLFGIEVIATGQDTSAQDPLRQDQPVFETVTLATTAEQAVKLVAARQSGTITAVLSQSGNLNSDQATSQHVSGHLAKLLGLEAPRQDMIPVIYGDRSDALSQTSPEEDIDHRGSMSAASRH